MFEVVSVSDFSDLSENSDATVPRDAVTARRGGLLHGTKVATNNGWKPVERIVAGDHIRTLDHGFKEVRRVSINRVTVPLGETRAENLPVFVPARVTDNGRPVWLMPEQGIAVDLNRLDPETQGLSVVPARLLSGKCQLKSRAPGSSFAVSTLFLEQDEVICVEGGLQAYCPSGRFNMHTASDHKLYSVADEDTAIAYVNMIATKGDLSALAHSLGALPAPIPQEPVFPIRPPRGVRRPGRPGRPDTSVLNPAD